MKTLPTLYKKASTGAIQMWSIGVEKNVIITQHGKLGGKIQRVEETIKEGKNIGRSNETTPEEQALSEATSEWEKKLSKKGYVEDLKRAQAGENDFKGGYKCMLAHKFRDHGHKIVYPAYEQPKLNGHRCTAIIDNGVCTLWSREHEPITSCPHIVKELQEMYYGGYHEVDGELYNHAYHNNFEDLASLIRQEVPAANCTEVQYHVYDRPVAGESFAGRIEQLAGEISAFEKKNGKLKYIKLVETVLVKNEDEMLSTFEDFLKRGYEGAMARNAQGEYEGKRSYNLQKIKEFLDEDYPIVGINEGTGSYAGCGIFVCMTPQGNEFSVKMRGPKERLADFLDNPKLWKGKILVVKYQYISKYGIPIFPVGERFSDK